MPLATFLIGLVGPLAARLLTALGLTLVTMTGAVVAVGQLRDLALSNLNGMGSDTLQLAGLFGVWNALGMVFGTLTFVITWHSTRGFIGLAKS